MINKEVIDTLYRTFNKPPKEREDLHLEKFLNMLHPHHQLRISDDEIVNDGLEEFNPFKRFLIRNLYQIVEFDKMIAFVFPNHILFFGKANNNMRVHIKPKKTPNIFSRLFHRE